VFSTLSPLLYSPISSLSYVLYSRWFGPGRILRDFRPRHALLTMHIWFLHKRLIADGLDKEASLNMQEELFNILWDDTTCRIRQQGVNELLVNKHLLQVQQYSFLHLTHYDHAFTEFLDKPEERIKELRKIIWQHVFVRDEDMKDRTDHLDRLAWYVEANYQNILMDWPDEYYREARVAWVDLPDFSGLTDSSGKLLEENPPHPEDVLPKPWLRNITLRGVEYYWNPETMRSTWDRPTK
jgi:cytochrome b pre-mRNA-processing protein 3